RPVEAIPLTRPATSPLLSAIRPMMDRTRPAIVSADQESIFARNETVVDRENITTIAVIVAKLPPNDPVATTSESDIRAARRRTVPDPKENWMPLSSSAPTPLRRTRFLPAASTNFIPQQRLMIPAYVASEFRLTNGAAIRFPTSRPEKV